MTTHRRQPGTLAAAWLVARKDLAIEFRTRTAFLSARRLRDARDHDLLLRVGRVDRRRRRIARPGVLWVVLTFSALLGLQRSFGIEEHDRGIDALLVSPISREAIYLGKAIGNLIFLLRDSGGRDSGARAVLQSVDSDAPLLIVSGIVLLAMIGIVAVGTLFSAMAVNTRLAELLLPMLSLPFFVPDAAHAARRRRRTCWPGVRWPKRGRG